MMQNLSFDSLPATVSLIYEKVKNIEQLLLKPLEDLNSRDSTDHWLSVDELVAYLPGQPAKSTIYGMVHRREIPHKKMGRRLIFLQSEINSYLMSLKRKTAVEIDVEAENFIQFKKKDNHEQRKFTAG